MDLPEAGLQIKNCTIDFFPVFIKQEIDENETEFNDSEVIAAAQQFCELEIKKSNIGCDIKTESVEHTDITKTKTNANSLSTGLSEENEACNISTVYLQNLDCENVKVAIQKSASQITQVFINHNEPIQMTNYNISTVTIPAGFLGIDINIKKESDITSSTVYATEWVCNNNNKNNPLEIGKDKEEIETNCHNTESITNSTSTVSIGKLEGYILRSNDNCEEQQVNSSTSGDECLKTESSILEDKLKEQAECMNEKRKKLYEQESEEERQERLAKEAAKRKEARMYFESPEQRRKRLDAEAARKREYRMYTETPEKKRRRLDREAERRRIKRLSLYASETPEQRRERLSKESAKRREARLIQYAKETEDERKDRLKKEALRVREMRFTRSVIETEDERRERLVKEALRKRELRMHGGHSVGSDFAELQSVHNLEELNDVQIKDNGDCQLGGHYLSNWMTWFQNTLTQPVHTGEQVTKSAQNGA